jgi:hypothetical protein
MRENRSAQVVLNQIFLEGPKNKNRREPVWYRSKLIEKMYQDRIAELGDLSRGERPENCWKV